MRHLAAVLALLLLPAGLLAERPGGGSVYGHLENGFASRGGVFEGGESTWPGGVYGQLELGGVVEPPAGYLLRYWAGDIDGSGNSTLTDLDSVGTWVNLGSHSSADLTQGTASAKPTYHDADPPYVSFDGGDTVGVSSFATISQSFTIVLVAEWPNFNSTRIVQDNGSTASNRTALFTAATTGEARLNCGATRASGINLSTATLSYVNGYCSGTSSYLNVNGSLSSTGNAGTGSMVGHTIGAGYLGGSPFVGDVYEVIVYAGDKANDSDLLTYLSDAYGL